MSEPGQRWEIAFERGPERVLRRLPRDLLRRIDRRILALADDPRPEGCVRLAGYGNLYRVRVGDWRITYAAEEGRLIVLVVALYSVTDFPKVGGSK